MRDSAWIAQLLEWGLLRSSLVLPAPMRDLRELTRYRKHQIRDRAREVNRLHRVLEDAGLKLSTVATDVMGVSGRAMLEALLQGTTDPAVLADLAKGKLRKKLPALRDALTGHFRAHHRVLITQILAKVDFLDETIVTLTEEIDHLVVPFEPMLANLDTIPGVDRKAAITIVAETGGEMHRFPRCRRGTTASNAIAVTKKRSSPPDIRFLKLRFTSCAVASRTRNSALITSTGTIASGQSAGMSVTLRRSATPSRSMTRQPNLCNSHFLSRRLGEQENSFS